MNDAQRSALKALCERYNVPFNESDYGKSFDLPKGYVAGWIGGTDHGYVNGEHAPSTTIYVGCDPQGAISS